MFWRRDPGAKTFRIAAAKLDTGRPRNGLSLGGRRGVGEGVHFERALTLGTEGREDELLLLLSKRLSLPGEEMQEKYKRRVETAVGHWGGGSVDHHMHQIWEATLTVDPGADTAASAIGQVRNTELIAPLAKQVGATFASVQPPLGKELIGSIEGDGIPVASEQVHNDELNR